MHAPKKSDRCSVFCYDYTYDPLNRITAATGGTANYNVSNIGYDKNGNIQSLTRNGYQDSSTFTDMDILDYDYDNGNKLLKVADTGNKTHGFKDGTNTNDDFEYDINGNMISDANKGITSIEYNHLNLPTKVTINGSGGNGNIQYVYDADGMKLKKTLSTTGVETLYANGYVYEGGSLEFFSHPEGYVTPNTSGGFDYVYQYRDHVDNIRLSYTDADGNGSIDPANEIIEENNFYPFGLKHKGYNNNISSLGNSFAKKFKYQGQELDESLGYNMYEFELRHYDAAIGRFVTTDPYEQFDNPYLAMGNNPVVSFDPTGGYCYDSNGNQISCPTDAGDFYDDYVDNDKSHITILDEAGGTAEAPSNDDKAVQLKTDYDYSQETIPGKLESDLDYIVNGNRGLLTPLGIPTIPAVDRFLLILARDASADPDTAKDAGVDMLSAGLPFIRIGKYMIAARTLHRTVKPTILKKVGKKVYERVVGKNPDIGVEQGKIILKGNGPFKGKTHRTNLDADDFLSQ